MILDSTATKEKILSKFLPICQFDGWNKEALLKAIKASEIEEKFSDLIFENGCLDLAEFYIETYNNKTQAKIAQITNFNEEKIRNKIRLYLYERFEVEKDNKIALQRLINFYISPKNFTSVDLGARPAILGLKTCYKIADFIWKNIDDQSTDFNFYTKRLTLAKIILRSLLVFVKDDSADFSKTKNFIDSQIEKVMKFEKFKAKIKKFSAHGKEKVCEFFLDENGLPKSPKKIIKNLPFIRLIKF